MLIAALSLCCLPVSAQYTLDEIGINAGGGFVHMNTPLSDIGAGANVNAFYGHYFCGKRYGIHTQAGLNYFSAGDSGFRRSQVQVEGGFFFKVKRRDYHRPKEWALIIGPKVQVPVLRTANYDQPGGTPEPDWTPVIPVGHISLQFRRPAPEKKSWFIQPGFEYGLLPDYTSGGLDISRSYIFLHLGYAFFDKRG